MFGQPITLNFNRDGDTYNTVLGGLCGITVKVFTIVYSVIKIQEWVNRDNNTYNSQVINLN